MGGIGQQHLVCRDEFLDARGGAVEALRQPRHLVLAFDLDARRQLARPERLDAGLQTLQSTREPAHDRIGADRHHQRDHAEEGDDAACGAACRAGGFATIQRSSGKRMAQAGPPRP